MNIDSNLLQYIFNDSLQKQQKNPLGVGLPPPIVPIPYFQNLLQICGVETIEEDNIIWIVQIFTPQKWTGTKCSRKFETGKNTSTLLRYPKIDFRSRVRSNKSTYKQKSVKNYIITNVYLYYI